MLKVIQFLKGYVIIRVWGFSPERFMNLCSNHNIFLWDIRKDSRHPNHDAYEMSISIRDFYKLRSIVKKTGTKVAIQRRYGLPFLLKRMKKRKIFIIGLLFSLFFWVYMSTYIWAIEIQGNYYVTSDVFMDFLADNQVELGMKRSSVNIAALEQEIRRHFDIVTWTSARIDGTRLVIALKENDVHQPEEKEPLADGVGYDLAAQNDGVVTSIITRSGIPLVSEGDHVEKGDILVEGKIPIYQEDQTVKAYNYCIADADIYIERIYQMEETLSEEYESKAYTGEKKDIHKLILFDKVLKNPFSKIKYDAYDVYEEIKQVKLLENLYLPIYYGTETVREYELVELIYTQDEVKEQFTRELIKFVETLTEKGVQIVGKNVTINKKNNKWYMNVDLNVIEKTGENILTEIIDIEDIEETKEMEEDTGTSE